jgi:hypothetical protein
MDSGEYRQFANCAPAQFGGDCETSARSPIHKSRLHSKVIKINRIKNSRRGSILLKLAGPPDGFKILQYFRRLILKIEPKGSEQKIV